MKLNERLRQIAAFVPQGARIADIGTDHAYLPVFLVQQNVVSWAIAGDVHEGPYKAASLTVRQAGLSDKISVRLGDGLTVIGEDEIDAVVIAGMGGQTMIEILQKGELWIKRLTTLVLQPMGAAGALRLWLVKHGWQLIDEALVIDDDRLYEVICAKRSISGQGTLSVETEITEAEKILYEVGPILLRKQDPLLSQHIGQKINDTKRILTQLNNAGIGAQEKTIVLKRQLQQLKELLP